MSNEVKAYTLEEVNAYRAEVYRLLTKEYHLDKESALDICGYNGYIVDGKKVSENDVQQSLVIAHWSYIMNNNTPDMYAYWSSI